MTIKNDIYRVLKAVGKGGLSMQDLAARVYHEREEPEALTATIRAQIKRLNAKLFDQGEAVVCKGVGRFSYWELISLAPPPLSRPQPIPQARDRWSEERTSQPHPQTSNASLTVGEVVEIRKRLAERESQASIARRFAIDPSTVGKIVRGETWASVPSQSVPVGPVWKSRFYGNAQPRAGR